MDARMDSMSRTRASTSVALEQQVRSSGPAQQRPGTGHKGPHSKKPAAKPLPKKPILLGMDLGTEYSKVYARLLAGQGADITIHLSDRSPEICSHALVSNTITLMDATSTLDGEWVRFGSVRTHRHHRYHLLRCWKKYIGATISDVDVDKVSEEFGGLKIVSDGSAEQFMAIAVTPLLAITPHQLLVYLLTFMKKKVPLAYYAQHIVLTLPVAANDRLRTKYIDAASAVFELPRNHVHLVGEPLAGLYSRLGDLNAGAEEEEEDAEVEELEDKAIVVLDVGAGTTDLVVLYKRQVLAAHGNNWLGGSDVDMLLLNCVPDHLLQGANANLLDCLRRAKEQLCRDVVADPDADPASLVYEEVHDPAYAGLRVTWADLVAACQPLKEPLVQALRDLLDMAGLKPAQVGRVVGMGGAFDLPCVGDAIREVFDEDVAVDPTAGGAAREIVQGAVDLLHKKVMSGSSGLSTVAEAGGSGAAVNRLLPSPENFLRNLPLSQPIYHKRGVYLREEWKEPHMKEKELRGIKAGLLAQGEQRAQEEAALDACIAAKRKRAAQPPQGVPEAIMTLEQLLTGRECPPCTSTVPGHLGSYASDPVNIKFDLYQGLPRCAVYIGSAKIPLTRQEHFTAQITVDANHCIGVELRHSNGEVQQLQLSWDKVCAEVSRAGHARRTELLKPAARAFLTAGSEQLQLLPAAAAGGPAADPAVAVAARAAPAVAAAAAAVARAVLPPMAALAAAPLLHGAAGRLVSPGAPAAVPAGHGGLVQNIRARHLPAGLRVRAQQQQQQQQQQQAAPGAAAGAGASEAAAAAADGAAGAQVPAAPVVKISASAAAAAAPMVKASASAAAAALAMKQERCSATHAGRDQDPEPAAAEGRGRSRGGAGAQQAGVAAAAGVPIKRSASSGLGEPGAGVPAPALEDSGGGKRARR